eukprot:2785809-Prymnesium_polylepis.1
MDWEQLDGSLVDTAGGGFDAYGCEGAAARHVARPSWSHKLLLYQHGEASIEKRGFFTVAKIEEMALRALKRAGAGCVRAGGALISFTVSPLARRVHGARSRAQAAFDEH